MWRRTSRRAVSDASFAHEPRIYFGEGAKDDYVLTNVRGLKEFDHVTDQDWMDFAMPAELRGRHSGGFDLEAHHVCVPHEDLTAFLFSTYIDHQQTRVHILRTPMLRAQSSRHSCSSSPTTMRSSRTGMCSGW